MPPARIDPALVFPETTWERVAEAMALLDSHANDKPVREFAFKVALEALRQGLAAKPGAVAAPSGGHVLLSLLRSSPELGMEWWRLRGEAAWLPTPHYPYPLVEVCSLVNNAEIQRYAHKWKGLGETVEGKGAFLAFLKDGMRVNMPLLASDTPDPKDSRLKEQEKVVHYCAEPCLVLDAQQKLGALMQADGALVVGRGGAIEGLRDCSRVSSSTRLWMGGQLLGTSRPGWQQSTLLDAIEQEMKSANWSTGSHDLQTQTHLKNIAWLKRQGQPTDEAWGHFFHRQIGRPLLWERCVRVITEHPEVWSALSPSSGALCWQEMFATQPDWLKNALSVPELRAHFSDKDPSGRGIWGHLFEGVRQGRLFEQKGNDSGLQIDDLKRVLALAPFSLVTDEPLLTRELPAAPRWWFPFMCQTVPQSLEIWVGPNNEAQSKSALPLLLRVLVGQGFNPQVRVAAALNGAMLDHLSGRYPGTVSEATEAVLWAQREVINKSEQGNLLEGEAVVLRNWVKKEAPQPDVTHMAWATDAIEMLPRPDAKRHKTVDVFLRLMRFAGLNASWPKEQLPRRSKPRF